MHNPKVYKNNTTGNSAAPQNQSGLMGYDQGLGQNSEYHLGTEIPQEYQGNQFPQGQNFSRAVNHAQAGTIASNSNVHPSDHDHFSNPYKTVQQPGIKTVNYKNQPNSPQAQGGSVPPQNNQNWQIDNTGPTRSNSNPSSLNPSNSKNSNLQKSNSQAFSSQNFNGQNFNGQNSNSQRNAQFSPTKNPANSPFKPQEFGYGQQSYQAKPAQKNGNPFINIIFTARDNIKDGIKNIFSNSYYQHPENDTSANYKKQNFASSEYYESNQLNNQSNNNQPNNSTFGRSKMDAMQPSVANYPNPNHPSSKKGSAQASPNSNLSSNANPRLTSTSNPDQKKSFFGSKSPLSVQQKSSQNGIFNIKSNGGGFGPKVLAASQSRSKNGSQSATSSTYYSDSNGHPFDHFLGSHSPYTSTATHRTGRAFNPNSVRANSGSFNSKNTVAGWMQNFGKNMSLKKTPFLVASVLLVYTIIGFGFGFFIFNNEQKDAQAGEVNFVSTAIKIDNPKVYRIGDQLEVTLTVQNTSSNKTVTGVSLEMISTKNSVRWTSGQKKDGDKINFQDQVLNLDSLYNSERAEYKLTGTLQRNDFDVLFLLGKVRFLGSGVDLEVVETNRAFTEIREVRKDLQTYLLSTQKTYKTGESANILIKKPNFEDALKNENQGTVEIEGEVVDLNLSNQSQSSSSSSKQSSAESTSENFSSSVDSQNSIESGRILGTVFVSSEDKTVEYTCDTDQDCLITTDKLSDGNYSVVFVSRDGFYYSQIQKFVVGEGKSRASLGPQVNLTFPLGTSSYNGLIPFRIENAISLNKEFDPEFECELEVWQNDNKISERKVLISPDRVCRGNLDLVDFKKVGVYEVRLLGADKNNKSASQAVIFGGPDSSLITLKNVSEKTELGNNVQIQIDGLSSSSTQVSTQASSSSQSSSSSSSQQTGNADTFISFEIEPAQSSSSSQAQNMSQAQRSIVQNGVEAEIKIYHPNSGQVESIKSLDGKILQTQNQTFFANIPASYFQKGGLYQVLVTFENGVNSSFLNIDLSSQEIGYIDNGISYDSPVAGKKITFTARGLRSKDGSLIDSKECSAKLYPAKKGVEETKNGKVEQGVCSVTFDENQTKIAGPAIIDIQGLAQSFEILPGEVKDYGQFSLEYSPARVGNGNTVIIGPVVDSSGNLTSAKNLKLNIRTKDNQTAIDIDGQPVRGDDAQDDDESSSSSQEGQSDSSTTNSKDTDILKSFEVEVESGFAEVFIPSSIFNQEGNLKLELMNPSSETGEPILEKQIFVEKSDKILLAPNRIGTLSSDKNLNLSISGLTGDYLTSDVLVGNCKMRIYKTMEDMREVEAEYDRQAGSCAFDWEGSGYRDRNFLVELNIDKYQYHQLVKVESGQANNVFEVLSANRYVGQDKVLPRLVTTPIFDSQGVPVSNQKIRWRLNGRTFETNIENGFAKLELTSDKLETQDIRESQLGKTLNIDLDASASTLSISKTNSINSFLGNKKISDKTAIIKPASYQNQVSSVEDKIFAFESNSCEFMLAPTVSSETILALNTLQVGKNCLVQIPRSLKNGNYSLIAKENGFEIEKFGLQVISSPAIIQWCKSSPCDVSVYGGFQGQLSAQILDGDNVYKFVNKEIENTLGIEQKDLDKLQKYIVLIEFQTEKGKSINYKQILGEYLIN